MIEPFHSKYLLPTKEFRCLSVLFAINESSDNSQSAIGDMTNLSSSMVNNYIKNFKHEGLITVTGNTNRTQSYFLTEKGRNILTCSLLGYSAEIVQLYSAVKNEMISILNVIYEEGIRTVVLFGAAETAEIVHAAIKDTDLVVIGVVDNSKEKHGKLFNGLMIRKPGEIMKIKPDGVIITSFARQEEIYAYLKNLVQDKIKIKRLSTL
jgi:DNA-binding MarR family transcriptional regulator